jgi:prevent-host-death family protein
MQQVDVQEVGAALSHLLMRVEAGEQVIIARCGHPVAVLASPPPPRVRPLLQWLDENGQDDFLDLPKAIARALSPKAVV